MRVTTGTTGLAAVGLPEAARFGAINRGASIPDTEHMPAANGRQLPMELTADLLREILDALTAPPMESTAPAEQRRGPRSRAEVEATLLPFSDALSYQAFPVALRDVSRGGLGFLFDRPVPLGEAFGLVLPERDGPPTVVQCAVTYWQPLAAELYAIGASFTIALRQGGRDLGLHFEQTPEEVRKVS